VGCVQCGFEWNGWGKQREVTTDTRSLSPEMEQRIIQRGFSSVIAPKIMTTREPLRKQEQFFCRHARLNGKKEGNDRLLVPNSRTIFVDNRHRASLSLTQDRHFFNRPRTDSKNRCAGSTVVAVDYNNRN
jgi:hypothetical protein